MNNTWLRVARTSGIWFLTLAFGAGEVMGQSAPPQGATTVALEEITVTARKVEETLSSVPFSVSALTSKDIQDRDLQSMVDVAQFSPSFHFVNQSPEASGRNDRTDNIVSFRGLVLGSTATATTGSGSVFIDGAPVIDAFAPAFDEVARVEVLEGPQSAYFGRSTFAGAINYVTKDPSNDFHGTVNAEQSSYNSRDDYLSVEGPIVKDVLDLRVSAHNWVHGGEWTNAADTDETLGTQETTSFATTAVFTPIDKLKVKGFFNWFEDNDGPPAQSGIFASDGFFNCNPPNAGYSGGYICGAIPNANRLNPATISGDYNLTPFFQQLLVQNTNNFPVIFNPDFLDHAGLRRIAFQSDIQIEYALPGGYTLNSITAYHQDKNMEILDTDFRDGHNVPNPFYSPGSGLLPYFGIILAYQNEIHDLSQEIRLTSPRDDRIRWSAGINYYRTFSPGSALYGTLPVANLELGTITSEKTETPSVFGGVDIDLLPKLTLSLEGRYQWDDLTQTSVNGADTTPIKSDFTSFSPRVILDYKFIKDSSLYALWSRGYRPGGVNGVLIGATPFVAQQFALAGGTLAYGQERLDNYEVGVKSTFLDGRAQIAFDVYYDPWRNGQVPVTVLYTVAQGSNVRDQNSVIVNAGAIDLYGIEWKGNLQVTPHLVLQTAAAINDSNVKDYSVCSDCQNITGATAATGHIPGAPKYTWTMSADYSDHLFGEFNWFGRIDYNHQGSFFVDYSNLAYTHAADLVNLRLGLRNASLSLEAFVKNLTNNEAPLSALTDVNSFTVFSTSQNSIRYGLPDKRTVGLRASYRF